MTSSAESASAAEETDVFKRFLANTVQEVVTSVSFSRFRDILKPLSDPTRELYDHTQDILVRSMASTIENLSERNVAKKMKDLQELSKEYSSDGPEAWRPTTGQVNISALEVQSLEDRKSKLLEAITAVDRQTEDLRKTIIEKRNILKQQQDNIKHFDF